MSKSVASTMGTLTQSKYGVPTLTLTPVTASERRGKIVPVNTVKQKATRRTLLTRKADSRERSASSSARSPSRSQRQTRRPRAVRRMTAR